MKMGYHHPAQLTDPDEVNRQILSVDRSDISWFLHNYIPQLSVDNGSYKVCLYANSPDENFIIDKLSGFEYRVSIACGFSGHGFKFASVIGEILADLAIDGETKHPIGFLSGKRFL
jgi:sarcosine oxidase